MTRYYIVKTEQGRPLGYLEVNEKRKQPTVIASTASFKWSINGPLATVSEWCFRKHLVVAPAATPAEIDNARRGLRPQLPLTLSIQEST